MSTPLKDRAAEVVGDAIALDREFGEFFVRKDRMRQLITQHRDPDAPDLEYAHVIELVDCIAETQRKSAHVLAKAKAMLDAPVELVDWPDEAVEKAVRYLTSLDADYATEENRRGWSKAHSSMGHWCNAMLDRHPEEALRLARGFVGRYVRTQLGSGIADPSFRAPRRPAPSSTDQGEFLL